MEDTFPFLSTEETLVVFSGLRPETKELLTACVEAREYAYCPYSHFKVGAAVQNECGHIFSGCNVENASYGNTICAERTAMVKAVSEGTTTFSGVAVCGTFGPDEKTFVFPCGPCRQFIAEFAKGKDIPVYMVKPEMKYVFVSSIKQLLPHSFDL